jgi:hypothetical protein
LMDIIAMDESINHLMLPYWSLALERVKYKIWIHKDIKYIKFIKDYFSGKIVICDLCEIVYSTFATWFVHHALGFRQEIVGNASDEF